MKIHFKLAILASLALAASACQLPVFFPEFVVNTSNPGYNYSNDVAIGEDGDFIVIWGETVANDAEVLGRRFDRLTAPLDDPFPVNAATTNDQAASSIAKDAQGRFVVVWSDEGTTIWGRRFEPDGTPLGGNFQVNASTTLSTTFPHVASDPSGNFVVVWTSISVAGADVVARHFDSNGAPLGDEFQVNLFEAGAQRAGGVAMSPAGFAVSWGGDGSGTSNGIFARLFDAAGNPITDDLPVHTGPLTTPEPRAPDVAMNVKGDFVVVWDDLDGTAYTVTGRRWTVEAPRRGLSFRSARGRSMRVIPG